MKQQPPILGNQTLWQRSAQAWDRFWFTPADPSVLGMIRICCGLITLYTTFAYVSTLDEFVGPHAWIDAHGRLAEVREKGVGTGSLNWDEIAAHRPPTNPEQEKYVQHYFQLWGEFPPGEYPTNNEDAKKLNEFRHRTGVDLRANGMAIPTNVVQWDYALRFTVKHRFAPAPPYPRGLENGDETEERAIEKYIDDYGIDPRATYSKGICVWSLWLHVTDPGWMMFFQWLILLVTLLFTLGFCTRITAVLTWLGAVSYIHRNPYMLFGVDTMMNILLIYLMIGPSGAAYSVDRLLARWWSAGKP